MMIPKVFSEDVQGWRQWKEDVAKYFDEGKEGIKLIMEKVCKSPQEITIETMREVSRRHPEVTTDLERWKHLYRALEKLTDGEAARVISTVGNENGFEAWRQLHLRFRPELEVAMCRSVRP